MAVVFGESSKSELMPIPEIEHELRRRRDGSSTRLSILNAAETVFLKRGFGAATLSEIASRAKVNKSLISHHFGTKGALWQEVKRRSLEAYAKMQRQIMAQGVADTASLSESIRALFRFLQENPKYVRLSTWMTFEDSELRTATDPELLEEALAKLQEGQRSGRFRDDVDAWHILVVLLSLCTHWFMARNAYGQDAYANADPKTADQEYLEDMLKLLFEGLLPR